MNEIMQTVRDYYAEKKLGDIISVEGLEPSAEAAEALALPPEDMRENKMLLGYSFPPMLDGFTVVVLGARCGRDAFVASKLVGESGKVIAIEGCARGVEKANEAKEQVAQAFGFAKSNVHFVNATIEDLCAAGIADGSVDVVIANCAVSHSPFKLKVLSEVYRVLKEGGEFYEFDVFCKRRLDPEQKADPAIAGGLLAETGYDQDFRRTMRKSGLGGLPPHELPCGRGDRRGGCEGERRRDYPRGTLCSRSEKPGHRGSLRTVRPVRHLRRQDCGLPGLLRPRQPSPLLHQ
ncbi:methyltransferase domain-containing protein [Ellagibacter isourolithinifaciens]|uniref:methyltransferase domain-containing protein n=1 Tax=Ellagibacter isourolithinifaciens TaxID=2137581 RepID=UPI003F8A3586